MASSKAAGLEKNLLQGSTQDDASTATSSLSASVVNLAKNIVGAGVLALPAGVSAFSDERTVGITLSLILVVFAGFLSAYTFWLIGRLCQMTGKDTFAGAFGSIFGDHRAWIVSSVVITQTAMLCLMYAIIIGDLSHSVGLAVGVPLVLQNRNSLLILISITVLLPLSLLRSLKALAPFSALAVVGLLYTAAFIMYRAMEGAYSSEGDFASADPAAKPSFDKEGTRPLAVFVLISMCATAYIAHFNAARFFRELQNPTVRRFGIVTLLGFFCAFLLMAMVLVFGFLTFGGNCQGLILNNYATKDPLAMPARAGILASVIASFPLVGGSCRDDFLELLGASSTQMQKDITITILVFLSTVGATIFSDLGFVAAFAGAILGSTIVYIFPAVMLLGYLGPRVRDANERNEYRMNQALLVVGLFMAAVGACVTVLQRFDPTFFTEK